MMLTAALLALALQEPSAPAMTGPDWLDDLDQARATAAESGRALLIVFR